MDWEGKWDGAGSMDYAGFSEQVSFIPTITISNKVSNMEC